MIRLLSAVILLALCACQQDRPVQVDQLNGTWVTDGVIVRIDTDAGTFIGVEQNEPFRYEFTVTEEREHILVLSVDGVSRTASFQSSDSLILSRPDQGALVLQRAQQQDE